MNKDLGFLYNALLLSLGQEYEQYQELFGIIEEETSILKKFHLTDLLDFNARKERVVLSLKIASEARIDATQKITSHLHLDESVSMRQLVAYAPVHTRQHLLDYQEKFADLISKTHKINESNKDLITFSLSHIRNTFNYINMLTSPATNYSPAGKMQAGNLQGRLLSKEG